MIIGGREYDHIEVYDKTQRIIGVIDDEDIIETEDCLFFFCKSDRIGKEYKEGVKL